MNTSRITQFPHRRIRTCLLIAIWGLLLSVSARHTQAAPSYTVRYHEEDAGYYLCNSGGTPVTASGIYPIRCKAGQKRFDGIYYAASDGRISTDSAVWRIPARTIRGTSYRNGCYFFNSSGAMVTKPAVRELHLTCQDTEYDGFYCFLGKNGRMVQKEGLITLSDDTYYYVTDNTGKCLTDARKKIDGFSYRFNGKGVGKRTTTKLKKLKNKLQSMVRGYGGTWSIYVKRLDNNDSLTINNRSLYAASIIKPFVMASAYNQVKKGIIRETDSLTSLCRSMITVSSNDAYNELVRRQTGSGSFSSGRTVINNYLTRQGYDKTEVHHTLHPSGSGLISDGRSNVTSVKDCGRLLESIWRKECVDRKSSEKMLRFLLAQQRRWKIPAGLPAGTKVANKTGETNSADHDIAIVYGPKCTYILCVMSVNAAASSSRISAISRTVYHALN